MKTRSLHNDFAAATDAERIRPRFRDELERLWGEPVELDAFHVPRVFPRGGGGFTIQYVMRFDSANRGRGTLRLGGHLLGPASERPDYVEGHPGEVFELPDLGLVVPVFPFDPKLEHLDQVCAPRANEGVLRSTFRALGWQLETDAPIDCDVLAYRLEKRCVVRITAPADRRSPAAARDIIVKAVRPRKARECARVAALLESAGFEGDGIAMAKTRHIDEANGLHVMELAPGRSLHDLTATGQFRDACDAAARLLDRLHSIDGADLRRYTVDEELERLRDWTAIGAAVTPDLAAMVDDARRAVDAASEVARATNDVVCVHRDFYDKQVLYTPERSTLLDFDNLALGDRALDVGNFIAHLRLRIEQEPENARVVGEGLEAFEQRYGTGDAGFAGRVQWWQSATLLRLALLYSLRPRWRHLAPRLLGMAAEQTPGTGGSKGVGA